MCELATVIFRLVKMKSVCLRSNFSDKCDTEATLHPRCVYRMTAQIREKIPLWKTRPRFYLPEHRHEIWPGKKVHLDQLPAKTLMLVYFTYFPFNLNQLNSSRRRWPFLPIQLLPTLKRAISSCLPWGLVLQTEWPPERTNLQGVNLFVPRCIIGCFRPQSMSQIVGCGC